MRDAHWEKVADAAAAIEHTVESFFDDDRRDEVEGIVTVFDRAPPYDLAAYALRRFAEAMLAAIDAEERDRELADFDDEDADAAASHA